MDPTTTEPATQEPGVEPTTQPEEQPATAVTTPVTEPTTPTPPTEPTEPAPAENLDESSDPTAFWQKKGIDISTPEGLAKATQSYQESEKRMHQSTQKMSEIEKQLTQEPVEVDSDNPLVQRLANKVVQMERVTTVREFMQDNGITEEQNKAMGQWLVDNPVKRDLINSGDLTLQEAYVLSGIGDKDPTALKDEGKREALESLATKQRSTAPSGGAVLTTAPTDKDPILDVLRSND